jgi:hypothetical protein
MSLLLRLFLVVVGVLHAGFMCAELFPWSSPKLLQKVSEKLPKGESWTASQQQLVATIVHNAGIYNAVLAGGFFWPHARESRPETRQVFSSSAPRSPGSSAR